MTTDVRPFSDAIRVIAPSGILDGLLDNASGRQGYCVTSRMLRIQPQDPRKPQVRTPVASRPPSQTRRRTWGIFHTTDVAKLQTRENDALVFAIARHDTPRPASSSASTVGGSPYCEAVS